MDLDAPQDDAVDRQIAVIRAGAQQQRARVTGCADSHEGLSDVCAELDRLATNYVTVPACREGVGRF